MSGTLISPSGKVLVRRARCTLQPSPAPLATPVLVAPSAAEAAVSDTAPLHPPAALPAPEPEPGRVHSHDTPPILAR